MISVLVTGANGQLGRCLQDASERFPQLNFFFASRNQLDIENQAAVTTLFSEKKFDYCINTAAYTNVEKAESEQTKAFNSNAEAVKHLALNCKATGTTLIHISTDYVFDGKKSIPYIETDETNPINVYGASKLKGEQYIQEICEKHYIFRTSWLYSQYGHNFLNTILKYSFERKTLKITTEQIGTPTNANDLATIILQVITKQPESYGVYHYSNSGETTWYGFAEAILTQSKKLKEVKLAKTDHYRTFASRPEYSVLDNTKAQDKLNLKQIDWEESLKFVIDEALNNL